MPSISELRSRLASAQSRKAKARLSNLQCIDILLKVCKKNNVNLITSNDGMLFYTIEEVQNEVENELLVRGGRMPIFQLNSILNFQPDYIDRAVNNITQSSNRYLNSHGVIISTDYLKNLMIAINDRIQECGTVGFSELSKEYDLPLEMIKSYVDSNISTVIKGNVNGNIIESYTFEKRKVNNLKSALLAITMPISTQDVSRIIKININMVNDTIQSFLKTGEVRGLLKSGEYIPQSYMNTVEKYLNNYYSRNGYVEVKLVKSFTHLDAKFIDKMFPNNLKLDSVYINRDLFQPVSILINEAISSKTWREVTSMLPSVLSRNDWTLILNTVKNAAKSGLLMESVYVSNSFREDLISHLIKYMDDNKEKVEEFHKVFNESKLGSQHLLDCVEVVLGYEDDYDPATGDKDNHFVDLYQVYPYQVFAMIEDDLKRELMNMIVSARKASKASSDKKLTKDSTETLILHLMECEMTLKSFERVPHSSNNVILQFVAKELCSSVFNLLLDYYLRTNKLVEGSVDLDPNKRSKMVELIVDPDVKNQFKAFVTHLKNKDAAQCVSCSRELCRLMYINYNVKKDSRNFIKSKQTQYNQQLSSLTQFDSLLACFVCINLILLKNNQYLFINDKLWCLKEILSLFKSVLVTSEHFNLIKEIVNLVEEFESKDEDSDNKKVQEKTEELINAFKA